MPVATDLRGVADRANRELDAVHDFFEHSKVAWESFRVHVNGGYKVSMTNPATGTATDEGGLLGLSPSYIRRYLAAFTFRQFVSTFEAFFFAFFQQILQHNPWQFARSQLDFETVLKAQDRDEIISQVLLKQRNEIKYETVRGWFEAMNRAVKLACPTEDEIDALAEMKATRDVLEHNVGVVNEIYIRKAGKKARLRLGDRVEIDDTYHLDSWRLIKKVVTDLTAAASGKVGGP